MDDDTEDQREVELSSLEAIFPEIQRVDRTGQLAFKIELPVNPAKPVTVTFPAASTTAAPGPAIPQAAPAEAEVDSHQLSYLPSLTLEVSLPEGYPTEKPPTFTISTSPPWLTPATIETLECSGKRLWEDMGRDLVVFSYIDHVQQAAENVFDMVASDGTLEVDSMHKIAILDYDIRARRTAFEKETFNCGVCLGRYIPSLTWSRP
jgi:E3 ubiquitin-protein ligase RNF14